ncbi:MAG: hypothetical protein U0172_08515 [Nitrospiraceae bacterium]
MRTRRWRIGAAASFVGLALLFGTAWPLWAQDAALERLLRAQVLNKEFEGFDYYEVVIEDDRPESNGAREVTVVARGRFLDKEKWMKVLIVLAGDEVIGGEILEGRGLPPCRASASPVQQS